MSDLPRLRGKLHIGIIWPAEGFTYHLKVSLRKPSINAYWQFYRRSKNETVLLWQHETNDVLLLYNLILQESAQLNTGMQIEGALSTIHQVKKSEETKNDLFIEANLTDNLRHFLGVADTSPGAVTSIPSQPDRLESSDSQLQALLENQPIIKSLDLQIGRTFLAQTFMNEFNVASFAAFLFFLEQEFFRAVYTSRTPITLIIIQPHLVTDTGQIVGLPKDGFHEIARQIKQITRKTDILALYESGSLAILLPETGAAGGEQVAIKINGCLQKLNYKDPVTQRAVKAALVFGIATVDENINSLGKFLSAAEQACLYCRHTGESICSYGKLKQSAELPAKMIDTYPLSQLLLQLVSMKDGIFTFPVFISFLEREFHLAQRSKSDLYMLHLKMPEILPIQTHQHAVALLLQSLYQGDRFGHFDFKDNEVAIIRPKASLKDIQELAKRLSDSLVSFMPLEVKLLDVKGDPSSDSCLNFAIVG
jgi:hypothetical protein